MKKLILFSLSLLLSAAVWAQVANAEFNAVAGKYEKGKWESALESAESLMDNDKHRKKPEPYLWASMSYYQIHLEDDEKVIDRVKSPLRNALKYAGKAVSKDKDGTFFEANSEYFETMKEAGVAEAQRQDSEGDFRQASYTLKQILKFAPDDPYIQFAKGIIDIKLNSYFEAEKEIGEAFPILKEKYSDLDYQPDPISSTLLRPGVLYYIDHLMENAYSDSAKNVAMIGRVFFPLDEEIKQRLAGLE